MQHFVEDVKRTFYRCADGTVTQKKKSKARRVFFFSDQILITSAKKDKKKGTIYKWEGSIKMSDIISLKEEEGAGLQTNIAALIQAQKHLHHFL